VIARVAGICLIACLPARAQTPVAEQSWAWFLAASPAQVRNATRASAVDSAQVLGRMVLEERELLAQQFGFKVPVALSPEGIGAMAHPSQGIILDAQQLQRLRDSLPSASFRDVIRLLLAHEWGHMVQFRRYPMAELTDSTQRRHLECQADMIAGSILAPIIGQSPVGQESFRDASYRMIALAFNIGRPVWDFPWMHPNPVQRQLCITTGGVAGFHRDMIRLYERTGDPAMLAAINRSRMIDRRLFGPGDSLLPWTKREAIAIVTGVPTFPDANALIDYMGEVRAIARVTQFGPDSLRANAGNLKMSGAKRCEFSDTISAAQLSCVWDEFASEAIAATFFSQLKDLVRPVMLEVQWHEIQGTSVTGYRSQPFVRIDQKASLIVTFVGNTRTVQASFAAPK
jgi:hypothetical protein